MRLGIDAQHYFHRPHPIALTMSAFGILGPAQWSVQERLQFCCRQCWCLDLLLSRGHKGGA